MGDLTTNEKQVLNAMRAHWGVPMRHVAGDTGLSIAEVRRCMRSLTVHGLAEFGPLFSEDDGLVRGSGYYLNGAGKRAQEDLLLDPAIS